MTKDGFAERQRQALQALHDQPPLTIEADPATHRTPLYNDVLLRALRITEQERQERRLTRHQQLTATIQDTLPDALPFIEQYSQQYGEHEADRLMALLLS